MKATFEIEFKDYTPNPQYGCDPAFGDTYAPEYLVDAQQRLTALFTRICDLMDNGDDLIIRFEVRPNND